MLTIQSGIVAAFGNIGGVIFAMVFRFEPDPLGKPWWICGVICIVRLPFMLKGLKSYDLLEQIVNVLLIPVPVPKI